MGWQNPSYPFIRSFRGARIPFVTSMGPPCTVIYSSNGWFNHHLCKEVHSQRISLRYYSEERVPFWLISVRPGLPFEALGTRVNLRLLSKSLRCLVLLVAMTRINWYEIREYQWNFNKMQMKYSLLNKIGIQTRHEYPHQTFFFSACWVRFP